MKSFRILAFLFAVVFFNACQEEEEKDPVPVNRLQARAGHDRVVQINEAVVLNGENSSDGNKKPFDFFWTLKTKPQGSTAALVGENTVKPGFTPDVPGAYQIELRISQGTFNDIDEITIHATIEEPQDLPVILSEDVNEDVVLEDLYDEEGKPDYRVTTDIRVNAQLQIEPGVVIEFENDKGLQINHGVLIAAGTEQQKIVFTGVEKVAGYWKGIILFSNSLSNELSHAVVEYGGSSPFADALTDYSANVFLAGTDYSGGALKILNCRISQAAGFGVYLKGGSYLTGFSNNNFQHNTNSAIYIPADKVHQLDGASQFSDNGFDGAETGGVFEADEELQWSALSEGASYKVSSDLVVRSGLWLNEGVVLQFNREISMTVTHTGYLLAIGSTNSPITLTALTPTSGNHWKGILIESANQNNKIAHAEIAYAGDSGFAQLANEKTNLGLTGWAVIENCNIHHGSGWGIVATDGLINENVELVNSFTGLAMGNVKQPVVHEPLTLAGEWLDWWSVWNNHTTINGTFYDRNTGIWFDGAADPWSMINPGFGLKINNDGTYVWTIAEQSPMSGCASYSAEHFTGKVAGTTTELTFIEESWRSKFYFSCDESQNIDIEVQPGQMTLPFESYEEVHFGKTYTVLKLFSGGDSFKYYRLK
jgi:hypothetical protein